MLDASGVVIAFSVLRKHIYPIGCCLGLAFQCSSKEMDQISNMWEITGLQSEDINECGRSECGGLNFEVLIKCFYNGPRLLLMIIRASKIQLWQIAGTNCPNPKPEGIFFNKLVHT